MNTQLFKKICDSELPDHASFAIWNMEKITNVNIIYENVAKLNTDTVIVGLNPSGGKPVDPGKKFTNFHCKYRGCKDKYLMAAFQENSKRFVGSFMMDIVPHNESINQKNVDINKKDIDELIKELEFVEFFSNKNPLIICLGDKVYSALIKRDDILSRGVSIEKVSHHARKGYRKEHFVKEIQDLENKLFP